MAEQNYNNEVKFDFVECLLASILCPYPVLGTALYTTNYLIKKYQQSENAQK